MSTDLPRMAKQGSNSASLIRVGIEVKANNFQFQYNSVGPINYTPLGTNFGVDDVKIALETSEALSTLHRDVQNGTTKNKIEVL